MSLDRCRACAHPLRDHTSMGNCLRCDCPQYIGEEADAQNHT
jgi:hypothetical protein